ncbi:MAG: hypothetical protein GXO81_09340 [Chlorobi bacterium]|nr:hypothetical protein [Chlorobiota bacterium]
MGKRLIYWGVIILMVFLTSCVAKKKYLEMEAGRLKAEQEVRGLTAENNAKAKRIEVLIADFEEMKSNLLASNAIKDQYIDSLSAEIFNLTSNINRKSETLEEKDYAFEFEKRRLNNALVERDKKIKALQEKITGLENEIAEKISETELKSFDLKQAQNQASRLEGEIKIQEGKIESLQNRISSLQKEITTLQAAAKEKDAAITRLTNNVKLLKGQLGK